MSLFPLLSSHSHTSGLGFIHIISFRCCWSYFPCHQFVSTIKKHTRKWLFYYRRYKWGGKSTTVKPHHFRANCTASSSNTVSTHTYFWDPPSPRTTSPSHSQFPVYRSLLVNHHLVGSLRDNIRFTYPHTNPAQSPEPPPAQHMSGSLKVSLKRLHMPVDVMCCVVVRNLLWSCSPDQSSDWGTGCNWELVVKMELGIAGFIGSWLGLLAGAGGQEGGTLSSLSGWDPQIVPISLQHRTHQSIHK